MWIFIVNTKTQLFPQTFRDRVLSSWPLALYDRGDWERQIVGLSWSGDIAPGIFTAQMKLFLQLAVNGRGTVAGQPNCDRWMWSEMEVVLPQATLRGKHGLFVQAAQRQSTEEVTTWAYENTNTKTWEALLKVEEKTGKRAVVSEIAPLIHSLFWSFSSLEEKAVYKSERFIQKTNKASLVCYSWIAHHYYEHTHLSNGCHSNLRRWCLLRAVCLCFKNTQCFKKTFNMLLGTMQL